MDLSKWLQIVEQLAPLALSFTPAAPLAPFIVPAIMEAEAASKPGSGADKLAHVRQAVQVGIAAVNAQAGHVEIDPTLVDTALTNGVATVVSVVNTVHAARAEDAAEQPVAAS